MISSGRLLQANVLSIGCKKGLDKLLYAQSSMISHVCCVMHVASLCESRWPDETRTASLVRLYTLPAWQRDSCIIELGQTPHRPRGLICSSHALLCNLFSKRFSGEFLES
jgi:hypothetical protein